MSQFGSTMHERQHLYINGNWIEPSGEGSIEVINPTNEEVIGYVPVANESDADDAVQAARSAFAGWSTYHHLNVYLQK